jgi:tagaturonate reductase
MTGRRTIPFSLNKRNLKKVKTKAVAVPPAAVFELPEKILQFGTGALLRGLPAWCIDKANRQGIFNGRIVAVTAGEEPDPLMRQDGLYTICERSASTKELSASFSINAAISRVLNENLHWDQVLRCAANPEMQIVIAQTQASDLVLKKDNVHWQPPKSFPGKLLAFLYHRFKNFNGEASSGMVIIHSAGAERGKGLDAIVLELAHQNGLETAFLDWLETCNHFCHSVADRMVLTAFTLQQQQELEKITGYKDELLVMTESWRCWSIETQHKNVQKILSFSNADAGVILSPQLSSFGNMKPLRG